MNTKKFKYSNMLPEIQTWWEKSKHGGSVTEKSFHNTMHHNIFIKPSDMFTDIMGGNKKKVTNCLLSPHL